MSDAINPNQSGADPNTGNAPGIVMNSLPVNVVSEYMTQFLFWDQAVTSLNALYNKLTTSTLDEYETRAGDAMNKGKRKSLKEVGAELAYANGQRRYFSKKVYGNGLMEHRMRRKI